MKTYFNMLIVFIMAISTVDSVNDFGMEEGCEFYKFIPTIKVIAEWIHRKGFPNKIHSDPICENSDGKIFGECLAGFFGEKPPRCRVDLAVSKSFSPRCDVTFENKTFHHILYKLKERSSIDGFPTGILFDNKIDADNLCGNVKSYIKARINAANGGLFDKSKMKKYCANNEEICLNWNLFLKKRDLLLEQFVIHATFYGLKGMLKSKYPSEEVVNIAIDQAITALIQHDPAYEQLTRCIQDVFAIAAKHLF